MLKCSFQTREFGTAVQFVMQYYHTSPVSKIDRRRHQVDGVASEPQAFFWGNKHDMQNVIVMGWYNLSPQNPSALGTLFPVIYLSQDRSFCFSLRALWSLIYILCTFFSLKLPKILHKGKLCSLFYALSDEAKYPLIVDQRRQKNLEAIDERQAVANLRENCSFIVE